MLFRSLPESMIAEVSDELRSRVMVAYLKFQAAPPRLEAEMQTHKVASGEAAYLARVKLRVAEEGMEWVRIDNERGGSEQRLVSE